MQSESSPQDMLKYYLNSCRTLSCLWFLHGLPLGFESLLWFCATEVLDRLHPLPLCPFILGLFGLLTVPGVYSFLPVWIEIMNIKHSIRHQLGNRSFQYFTWRGFIELTIQLGRQTEDSEISWSVGKLLAPLGWWDKGEVLVQPWG